MDEQGKNYGRQRDGLSAWAGVMDAFREALEETFNELRERGGPQSDRARDAVRDSMRKAQEALDDARERLDFVPRREFDDLKAEVDALRRRIQTHEGSPAHHDHGEIGRGTGDAGGTGAGGAGGTGGAGPTGRDPGDGSPGV